MAQIVSIPGNWNEADGREVPIWWNYDENRRMGTAKLTTVSNQNFGDTGLFEETKTLHAEILMDQKAMVDLSNEDVDLLKAYGRMVHTAVDDEVVSLSLVVDPPEESTDGD